MLAPEIRKELGSELLAAGRLIVDRARELAGAERLHRSGDLQKLLRPSVKGTTLLIRDLAMRTQGKGAPYSYPRRWEYGGRPFLRPAIIAEEQALVSRIAAA